ncbi:MAG TPA: FAD-binding oxidoreductase [Gemmatimonadaceae bacterium]|nr:FAD-binding oxidoreductase [Gemmatimonadaceae bacterium]
MNRIPGVADSGTANTAEIRERVMDAADRGVALRIVGAGTWLDAGRPVRAATMLKLNNLRGIVEYTPGDLTLTARAGTTLEEIRAATAAEHQWLPLEPFGVQTGSLGATIATSSSGPLAHAYGGPRDQVLGLETVTGSGAIVRSGGRVVKNVAGFDLTRLFTGSWGTLGVITEVTVRLRALPELRQTYALTLREDPESFGAQLRAVRAARIAPIALECVSASIAARLGMGRQPVLLARMAGNERVVTAQRDVLSALGEVAAVSDAVWETLRAAEPRHAAVARFSRAPSYFEQCWRAAMNSLGARADAYATGSPSRGLARVVVPYEHEEELEPLMHAARSFGGRVVYERLPARAWSTAGVSSAVADRLSRGVKERFDPMHVLNPGILGGAE